VAMSEPVKTLKGKLLLDGGDLTGSFFHRSVLLICEHNAEGAFGLVLNRSSGSKVGELIVADLPETLKFAPLFLGGPVQPTALSFLHSDNFIPDANVFPNLNLGHSLDDLLEIGESFTPPEALWQKILKSKGGWKNKLLSQMPDDLSLN
jgi:putative transcriptional regulator